MSYNERSPLLFDVVSNNSHEQIDQNNIINNWTLENNITITNWKEILMKTSFIYQYLLDKYKTRLNYIMIVSLLFSTLATLIAAIETTIQGVGKDKHTSIIFTVSIIGVLINAIVTFINGFIKIYKFDDILTSYTAYNEKVDGLCYVLIDQLGQPLELRDNATIFIAKHSEKYLNIMKDTPSISTSDLNEATAQYNKYLEDHHLNYKFSQKFI